jgi:hypothetical protein
MTRSASAGSWEEHQPLPRRPGNSPISSRALSTCCDVELAIAIPAHGLCACVDATARRAVSARSFTHLIPRHDVVFAFTFQVLFDPTTLQG